MTLTGDGSSDADGNSLTYAWTQTSGTSVTLSSATAAQPTFTAPTAASEQTLVFSLLVNDGTVNSAADTVSITINASDTTAPTIASITRNTPSSSPTDADSVTWRVTFDEDVQNVGAGDFTHSGSTGTLREPLNKLPIHLSHESSG